MRRLEYDVLELGGRAADRLVLENELGPEEAFWAIVIRCRRAAQWGEL